MARQMGLGCLHHRAVVYQCSKWVWDASVTVSGTVAGRPPHLHRAPENGLVVWLLDWKMYVQSPSTSDRKLPPTDVATIQLMHTPAWEPQSHAVPHLQPDSLEYSAVWVLWSCIVSWLCSVFYLSCTRQIHINLIDMAPKYWTLTDSACCLSNADSTVEEEPNLTAIYYGLI